MRTLITYASKYGFTRKCADILAKKLDGEVDICDLSINHPSLADYDTVVIGGSIYAGKIRKPVELFCAENLDILQKKRLGLFICGMAKEEDTAKQLGTSFPEELLAAAAVKENFGGECNFEKMNFFEKTVMKKITGTDKSQTNIAEDNINRFAEQIKNG